MACDAAAMGEPFVGTEAVASGLLTKSQLETRHVRLFRGVYIDRETDLTAAVRAKAGWLWTGRRGIVAGFSAAALHGSKWGDDRRAVELIHDNHHCAAGIQLHRDVVEADEIEMIGGVACPAPTRTSLAGIDALAGATEIKAADVELLARRYAGRRGIARARRAADLFDAGAQSPKESWLRVADRGRPAAAADTDSC